MNTDDIMEAIEDLKKKQQEKPPLHES